MRIVGREAAEWLAAMHATSFARPWSGEEFAALLANPGVLAVASEQGFVLARLVLDEAEILTLAVVPESRRTGLGAAFIQRLCQEATQRGVKMLHLEVAEDNIAARSLYAKLGFEQAGLRPYYYGGLVNAVLMRRML